MRKTHNFTKSIVLFWLFLFMQTMSGCIDDKDSCPGFGSEPFIQLYSESSFKVYFENDQLVGDTLSFEASKGGPLKLPFDMHANTMHYSFFQNDSFRGKLTLNYHLGDFVCNSGRDDYYLLEFKKLEVDRSSDFRNIYNSAYVKLRIDSIQNLATEVNYYSNWRRFRVVF